MEKNKEYYESLDKRSKEYKEYISSIPNDNISKGVGDTVEKILTKTGIKSLVHLVFGPDCGCDQRKEKLNKMFPYKVECLTEEEYMYLDELFKRLSSTILKSDQDIIIPMYNRIFNTKQKPTQCSTCWRNIIESLKKLYITYKEELNTND